MYLAAINVLEIIFASIALLGIFLVWPFYRYRGLLFLSTLIVLSMVFNVIEETRVDRDLYLITPVITLGTGPAFYLFVRHLIYADKPYHWLSLLHLLPVLLFLPMTIFPQLVIAFGTISKFIYAYVIYKLIRYYHRVSFNWQSDANSLKLDWVIIILMIIVFLELIDMTRLNLQPYISQRVNELGQFFNIMCCFFVYCYLLVKAVRNTPVFQEIGAFEQNVNDEKSEQADDSHHIIFEHISAVIIDESLYKKARLSLTDLSQKTGFKTREISRSINLCAGKNFCDYINEFRINAVKLKLQNNVANDTMLEIALQAGFNSKSSFNASFKKITGVTPSQFVHQQR